VFEPRELLGCGAALPGGVGVCEQASRCLEQAVEIEVGPRMTGLRERGG